MQRIISYIYHYKNEGNILCRCTNTGFCRITGDCKEGNVTICLKDRCGVQGNARFYILRKSKEESAIISYDKVDIKKTFLVCDGVLNTKIYIEDCDGICVECGGRMYVSLWKEAHEKIYVTKSNVTGNNKMKEDNLQEKIEESTYKTQEKLDLYQEYTRVYNRLCKIRIILGDREYPAVKLKPYELMFLPRSCWRMANNVFVMDSYYHYGYILFMQYRGQFVLAVPCGIGNGMRQKAKRFGFEEYVRGYEYGKVNQIKEYYLKYLQ